MKNDKVFKNTAESNNGMVLKSTKNNHNERQDLRKLANSYNKK